MFQSPQWGNNSKVKYNQATVVNRLSFSPRNGEIILKSYVELEGFLAMSFSPRNGEIILKSDIKFSNSEVKVSVPAMGK